MFNQHLFCIVIFILKNATKYLAIRHKYYEIHIAIKVKVEDIKVDRLILLLIIQVYCNKILHHQ